MTILMADIHSFGDATLDVFLQMNEEDVEMKCSIQEQTCTIGLAYGEKIPVEKVIKIPGAGNGSNNAVGSSRLGMKASMVSVVGGDDVGKEMIANWKREKVATKFVTVDKKRESNYSTVINYKGERTILVYHEKRDYKFPKDLPRAKWVYYTSLGKGSEVMHKQLLAHVKKTGAKLCFQPGTHQLKLGGPALAPIIALSYMVIMNKEEAERVLGVSNRPMINLLKGLHAMGSKVTVITDGPTGSYAYDGVNALQMGIMDVPPVERTGCGDAFATAFVAALHHSKDLGEAMRWGTANSASVLSFIGPQKGLLTVPAMKKFLARFTDIQPKPLA